MVQTVRDAHLVPARPLVHYAWLSIAAAVVTIGLKGAAWWITGSVGLLSDALESAVNLVAAVMVLVALRVAARPPDDTHQYGHEKAEFFSAGAEGVMIVVAAGLIAWSAVNRLLDPQPIENLGPGVTVSVIAAGLNLAVASVLLRAGRRSRSSALAADGRHLLTDVATSAGVVVAVVLVGITGWDALDPIVALAVGLNILVAGGLLVARSVHGLMDPTLPAAERAAVQEVIERYESRGVRFHALRTRMAGRRRFLSVHVLVPGGWSVREGHAVSEEIERDLRHAVDGLTVHTHLEPVEDPTSYLDQELDREDPHP
jgi:cation diffusion facilitator family transporter